MLPDDVLLNIFDFYMPAEDDYFKKKDEWTALAHVCRRWRSVVFQSPNRLNLRLVCTPYTRVRETLDIWPPLPLIISTNYRPSYKSDNLQDNIIAALEHNNRCIESNSNLCLQNWYLSRIRQQCKSLSLS
jgi:hypothetical protein